LQWAEALILLAVNQVPDAVYDAVRREFEEIEPRQSEPYCRCNQWCKSDQRRVPDGPDGVEENGTKTWDSRVEG
jgi:hypothetical protein